MDGGKTITNLSRIDRHVRPVSYTQGISMNGLANAHGARTSSARDIVAGQREAFGISHRIARVACLGLWLLLAFLLPSIKTASAQNWNAWHFGNSITNEYNVGLWSEAVELDYDARVATTPWPSSDCKPLGWQVQSNVLKGNTYERTMAAMDNCGSSGIIGAGSYQVDTCTNGTYWGFIKGYDIWECTSGYFLPALPENVPAGHCNCQQGRAATGEPVEISTGNVYEAATDFISGEGRLRLDRHYNSNPHSPDVGHYGWLDSFTARHIYSIDHAVPRPFEQASTYPVTSSAVYGSAAQACEQGISDLANGMGGSSGISTYAGLTASYTGNGQCQLSNGTVMPVLYTNGLAVIPGSISDASAGYLVYRPDGSTYSFVCGSSSCNSVGQSEVTLIATSSGFTLTAENGDIETYDTNGNLQSIVSRDGYTQSITYNSATNTSLTNVNTVTDSYGRVLAFNYNANGLASQVTLPDGTSVQYGYDPSNHLTSVTYPDGSTIGYQYTNANFPSALTARVDETNTTYATWSYDNTTGMATSLMLAGNVDTRSFSYGTNATTWTDALGVQRTFNYQDIGGGLRLISVNGSVCSDCMGQNMSYDTNGYLKAVVDWNGNTTNYTYGSTGLLQQLVEGAGNRVQRTTNWTWNTSLRVPLAKVVLDASNNTVSSTQWIYNAGGEVLTRCEMDPLNSAASGYSCSNTGTVPAGVRRSTYTYCVVVDTVQCPIVGLMLTATGPRTDLTQTTAYSYYLSSSAVNCGTPGAACYQAGDLHTVTDALGHVTTIASYDADGRPTRITDVNGVNTDMTYTPRGWLASRSIGGATTNFTYTAYGAVQTVTDPDGVTTSYGYDAAHRLTKVTDALGNYIQYTLDAAGDKTTEQTYDSSGTLHKSLTRTYNTLGQLTTVVDGLNNTVFNAGASGSYDANGNLIQSSDGLGIQRQMGYDALNRLVQTLDNYNGADTATQNTKTGYQYDSLDRLTQVTDPSSLNTTYSYDGLSDATGQVSPDTGTTSRTFDAAGNVLTRTDAKGITATNSYDALNRLISTSYPDSTQNVTYSYDDANSTTNCSTSYPVGRLTRIIENSVTTIYCYDARGNVIQKQQILNGTTDTTAYGVSAAGRLSSLTYPSGTQVTYARDGDGRIQSIGVTPPNGSTSTAVSSVTYQPFGPVSGYTLGNGQVVARTYDANYRLTDLTSPAFNLHVARDVAGDITAIGNAPGANPATDTYSYDPLYRLTAVTEATGTVLESVTYNQTGDRLSKTGSGLATGAYSYNPNTHQLIATGNAARSVDANGNTTAISEAGSSYGFGYSDRNRMAVAQLGGSTVASYTYNVLNQRVQKAAGSTTERYGYNGGSQILDEYGATNRDYIWMDGIPVANVDMSGTTDTIAYVTADQLGTPRAIADGSGNTQWQNAYQGNPWNEQAPTGSGYVYNLGFPGQYFDAETGLFHNGFRDYDFGSGRYTESDPIGLNGGMNTYAYVGGNPIRNIDPFGLAPGDRYHTVRCAGWNALNDINSTSKKPTFFHPNGREYGGWIYQNQDGTFSYTAPVAGGSSEMDPDTYNPIPSGTQKAGWYHTHGGYDPGANYDNNPGPGQAGYTWEYDGNEVWSQADISFTNSNRVPGYLDTPGDHPQELYPYGKSTLLNPGNCGCQ
jgi:RHS repeat-associated protein